MGRDNSLGIIYPNHFKLWDFGFEKALGLSDRKLPNIKNMRQRTIA